MPPKKEQKSKAQKMLAASSASKSKGKKKKWSKGKIKEKKSNIVVYDPNTYNRVIKDIPKLKLITISSLSEKYKINGSLARRTIAELERLNLIKRIVHNSNVRIYTRMMEDSFYEKSEKLEKEKAETTKAKVGGGSKKKKGKDVEEQEE